MMKQSASLIISNIPNTSLNSIIIKHRSEAVYRKRMQLSALTASTTVLTIPPLTVGKTTDSEFSPSSYFFVHCSLRDCYDFQRSVRNLARSEATRDLHKSKALDFQVLSFPVVSWTYLAASRLHQCLASLSSDRSSLVFALYWSCFAILPMSWA